MVNYIILYKKFVEHHVIKLILLNKINWFDCHDVIFADGRYDVFLLTPANGKTSKSRFFVFVQFQYKQ